MHTPHIYCVNEGSSYAPLERGPVRFKGAPLDLSTAEVRVRVVREGTESVIAWDAADGLGEGSAAGVMSWTMPEPPIASGHYQLWWRFERPGESPTIIGPDELQIHNVP